MSKEGERQGRIIFNVGKAFLNIPLCLLILMLVLAIQTSFEASEIVIWISSAFLVTILISVVLVITGSLILSYEESKTLTSGD